MHRWIVIVCPPLLLCGSLSSAATFSVLPDMGPEWAQSYARLLTDGTFLTFGGGTVSRWTADGQHTVLADVPTQLDGVPLQPTAISPDGSTVIGVVTHRTSTSPSSVRAGFRWTAATGVEYMPAFTDVLSWGVPTAVSADGSVIVGVMKTYPNNDIFHEVDVPFRWTAAT